MQFSFVDSIRRIGALVCVLMFSVAAHAQFVGTPGGRDDDSDEYRERRERLASLERGPFARKPASYEPEVYRMEGLPRDPTVIDQIGVFFKDLVGGIRIGKRARPFETDIKLEPKEFSLKERREITTTFSVTNRTKKLVALEFPTQQRVDILVRGADGTVIERWSDDHAFLPEDGFVTINPNERIEYSEKIATREMKGGQTYHIDAKMVEYPEYEASIATTPTDSAPEAETPAPAEP